MSGFALEEFRGAQLAPRTETIPVPELAAWFHDAPAAWVVRGLTGAELARAAEASSRVAMISTAVEALASSAAAKGDQVEAMRGLLGIGDDTPPELVKKQDYLIAGSVSPAIDRDIAVRLFQSFPVVAFQLTNKITELTGLGAEPGKAPHSTPTEPSESPSPSAI